MSDSIIKLNDDNKRAFKCLRDCGWEIAATQSLRQTAIVIDAGVFGNPDDPCWKLLIASKLPMYYTIFAESITEVISVSTTQQICSGRLI